MIKLASFALSAALGVAGVAQSLPAAAYPVVSAREGVVVAPAVYVPIRYRPYYVHDRYWHHGYYRYDRFHRGWEHGWDHR
jgi:hypothetical protein